MTTKPEKKAEPPKQIENNTSQYSCQIVLEKTTLEKAQDKQRNNLSLFTKRLLEKYEIKASTTDITKLLITEIWDTGSTQDKIRFAMWRGHEVQTAARTYATAL